MQLATVQALVSYWGSGYDWRTCEAKLNALPQFSTEIDGGPGDGYLRLPPAKARQVS